MTEPNRDGVVPPTLVWHGAPTTTGQLQSSVPVWTPDEDEFMRKALGVYPPLGWEAFSTFYHANFGNHYGRTMNDLQERLSELEVKDLAVRDGSGFTATLADSELATTSASEPQSQYSPLGIASPPPSPASDGPWSSSDVDRLRAVVLNIRRIPTDQAGKHRLMPFSKTPWDHIVLSFPGRTEADCREAWCVATPGSRDAPKLPCRWTKKENISFLKLITQLTKSMWPHPSLITSDMWDYLAYHSDKRAPSACRLQYAAQFHKHHSGLPSPPETTQALPPAAPAATTPKRQRPRITGVVKHHTKFEPTWPKSRNRLILDARIKSGEVPMVAPSPAAPDDLTPPFSTAINTTEIGQAGRAAARLGRAG
ncbi:hypothetical protein RQP46_001134 [Phenoliferia psychrophenolica]